MLLDFIAPRHCAVCGRRLQSTEKSLCVSCLLDLNISEYFSGESGNRLERTMWQRLPLERAAAFMTYDHDDAQHEMVLNLKYHNQPRIGYHIGKLMSRQLIERRFFEGVDMIVPVPIPYGNRVRRGYNQSEQLALGISEATGIGVNTHVIRRRPYNSSQTHLTAAQRQENVRGSFVLNTSRHLPFLRRRDPMALRGKHILVVDDVITSTATMQECGKTLCQIPDIRLSVLSMAVSRNLINNIRKGNPVPNRSKEEGEEE